MMLPTLFVVARFMLWMVSMQMLLWNYLRTKRLPRSSPPRFSAILSLENLQKNCLALKDCLVNWITSEARYQENILSRISENYLNSMDFLSFANVKPYDEKKSLILLALRCWDLR